MAVSPEAQRDQQARQAQAPPHPQQPPSQGQAQDQPQGQVNPSGFHDPMPGPAIDQEMVDGAPRVWTIYPFPQPYPKQTFPTGMWPYESPMAKAIRAERGENPAEPPMDYDELLANLWSFPFGTPEEQEAMHERINTADRPAGEAARMAREQREQRDARQQPSGRSAPAAHQH